MPPKVTNPSAGIAFTPEQFEELLSRLMVQRQEQPPRQTTATPTNHVEGNFTKCTSRFDGSEAADVEAFLDAIITYKECAKVSDESAFRGISMLLEGIAATWWKGIKNSIADWNGAVTVLREAYSRKLPPPLIYRKFFEREQQDSETTELFVCQLRALLSQLPYVLPTAAQLDMVYGLLKRGIRKRLTRNEIDTFSTLLQRARDIEMSEREVKHTTRAESKSDKPDRTLRPKCTFCKYYGHTESECRKKTQAKVSENAKAAKSQTPLPVEVTKPQVTCYGCGTPGYIRSTCPTCRPGKSNDQMTSSSFIFNEITTSTSDQANRPMIAVSVQEQTGLVCLDTGSRGSIASTKLQQVLTTQGYKPRKSEITIRLADGEPRHVSAHLFDVDITVNHRTIPMTLIAIPELPNCKTLLGVDFLKKANMVLDLTKDEWYFSDETNNRYRFLSESSDSDELITYVSNETLILGDEEGKHLDDNQRTRMNLLLTEYADVFSPNDKPTSFAEHTVQLTDETPIAVPPYRMTPEKRRYLETEIEQMLAEDIIEECESPYAAPVVLVPKKDGKDHTKPYVLKTDASSYALGAVLLQGEAPMERPVEYASRLLTAPERNYSTTEREALAVVWAVDKFRGYLEGAKITIISDHQPLKWLMSLKSPTGRLARWALALQPYDISIEYTPGRSNVVPDTLSRPACSEESESISVCSVTIALPTVPAENTRAKQLEDASKIQADRRRRDDPPYDTGDQVLVHVHALSKAASSYTSKFAPKQDGPYLICKQMSPTTYQMAALEDPRTPVGVYHVSALTRYVPSD